MPGMNSLRSLPKQVRFLAGESTGSYVTRLAARNNTSVTYLLDGVGQGQSHAVDPRYTELYVDAAGRARLAALAGRSVFELKLALVSLRDEQLLPEGQDGPAWKWPWEPKDGYLVRACALCAAARNIAGPVWLMRPDTWNICVRHGRLTDNSRDDSRPFARLDRWPQTLVAEQQRQRLQQRLGPVARTLVADAFAVLAHRFAVLPRLGGDRGRVIHLLPRAIALARLMARVEQPRLTGRLTSLEYARWSAHVFAELPQLRPAIELWQDRHCLDSVQVEYAGGRGTRPSPAAPHESIPELASVDRLTCLPWDMMSPGERPFG